MENLTYCVTNHAVSGKSAVRLIAQGLRTTMGFSGNTEIAEVDHGIFVDR